jgi:acyl transferase domain-containing protein
MMEPIVGPLTRLFENVKLNAPRIPVVSNVTGTWLTPAQAADPAYWARHMSQTVRFGDAVRELLKAPGRLLVEVGPGQALGAWALQHPASDAAPDLVVASSLRHSYDQQPDTAFILNSLGRLWLAGAAVDWKGFTAGEQRRRVPLPTYPFERRRYWVDPPKQGQPIAAETNAAAPARSDDLSDWFYLPLWKQTRTPVPFNADAGGARNWLVFSDGGSLSERLLELLAESGRNVSTVTSGERFETKGGGSYVVNPASAEDYEALFKSLRAEQQAPQHVVHLWGTEASESFELSQERGVHSLFALAKALGNAGRSEELRLLVVTRGVLAVTGSEDLRPERATALGPCKVIPQEYPHVRCLAADVDAPPSGSARERELADLLLAEATAPASTDAPHELVVAYRGSRRWAQTFASQRLERPDAGRMLLREGGTYLITGGLGGVGLTLAEHLARTHSARLVLTGRTPLPPREEWERLAARGEDVAVSRKLRKLLELEAAGADVLALSADVSDLEQMRAVVAAARARFGRIDGVIHAAGVQPGGLMQVKEREALERVLAPKVRGALVLAELFADDEPDFVLLCSSLNAIYGTLGLADHCAANSFLDAFAHASAARGEGRVVSINWDAWLEVGQAANAVVSQGLRQILGEERKDDGARLHPLLDRVEEGAAGVEVYTTRLSTARHWVVDEHRLRGQGLVPGTAYLEMVRAAYARRAPGRPVVLRKVVFSAPLLVADGEEKEVRTTLTPSTGAEFEFSIESRAAGAEGAWQEHARGRVGTTEEGEEISRHLDIAEIRARCADREVDVAEERARLRADGGSQPDDRDQLLRFGPRWENLLRRLSAGTNEGLAFIELPEDFDEDLADFGMHPSLLDVATGFAQLKGEGIYLPLGYERLTFKSPLARRIYSHVRYREQAAASDEAISCDIRIMDEDGKPLVEIEDFVLRRVHAPASHGAQAVNNGNGPRPPSQPTQTAPAQGRAQPEGIAPREGAEVLTRLLTKDLGAAQVAVSARDLDALIRQVGSLNRSRILEELERLQTIRPRHPRPNVPTPYAAPRNEVEQGLAEVWQEMLGVEEVGVNDNFFDLGGDSLLASQLISRLEKSFQVDMSLRNLFAAPTVAELAVLVLQKQSEQVDTAALAEVLAEIKGLTPAELQALLDADAQPTDVKGSHE